VRQVLFTPWRYAYITGQETEKVAEPGCFFCAAARDSDDPQRLVVYRSEHFLVMLNRHPYSSGHLLVAPLDHRASPDDDPAAAQAALWPLVLRVQRVLQDAYAPHGFNVGVNLGSAAGAGVPGHWHLHVVPRWRGDSNFMGAIGDVRLVPEDLDAAHARLRRLFAALATGPSATRETPT